MRAGYVIAGGPVRGFDNAEASQAGALQLKREKRRGPCKIRPSRLPKDSLPKERHSERKAAGDAANLGHDIQTWLGASGRSCMRWCLLSALALLLLPGYSYDLIWKPSQRFCGIFYARDVFAQFCSDWHRL